MKVWKFFVLILMRGCLFDVNAQTIRNKSNNIVGKIESDGTIRDGRSNILGKVESNGTVRSKMGSILGRIENNGTVRNSSCTIIGSAPGVSKRRAAVFFFFKLF